MMKKRDFLKRTDFRSILSCLAMLIMAGPAFAQVTPTPPSEEQVSGYAASEAQKNVCPWLFAHPTTSAMQVNATLPNVQETELSPYAGSEGFATAMHHAFPLNRILSANFDVDNDGKTDTVFLIGYLQQRPGAATANLVVELKASLGMPTPQGGDEAFFKQLVPPPNMESSTITSVLGLGGLKDKATPIYYFDRWKLKLYRRGSPGMESLDVAPGLANIRLLNVDGMNLLWVITANSESQFLFRYTTENSGSSSLGHHLVLFCQSS